MNTSRAFSGLSVDDAAKAKEFYTNIVGLTLTDEKMGLTFGLPGGGSLFLYQKDNHAPATYTALNLVVPNIDDAADELARKGVTFERYEGFEQDEKGIARSKGANQGPDIAWFKDPAGNILSIIQE